MEQKLKKIICKVVERRKHATTPPSSSERSTRRAAHVHACYVDKQIEWNAENRILDTPKTSTQHHHQRRRENCFTIFLSPHAFDGIICALITYPRSEMRRRPTQFRVRLHEVTSLSMSKCGPRLHSVSLLATARKPPPLAQNQALLVYIL